MNKGYEQRQIIYNHSFFLQIQFNGIKEQRGLHVVHDLLKLGLDNSERCHLLFRVHGLGGGFSVGPVLTATVETSTSSDKISIVSRGNNGDSTGGTAVDVAEAVGQVLQGVRSEVVVVIQDVVVSRARSTLQTSV